MAIYQGLYGVELTCPQKKAKELYEKAKEKSKEVKNAAAAANAADTDDNSKRKHTATPIPSLSDIGEAKNMMDPERICKLNAVGFEWELQKDTYVESWENRYNQLLKFKVINGHCRVPKSSGDNPQLGQWVKQVRYSQTGCQVNHISILHCSVYEFKRVLTSVYMAVFFLFFSSTYR